MITRHFSIPLLGIGLLASLAGCGKDDTDTDTPVKPGPTDTHTGAADEPRYPAAMFFTGIWMGWDDAENKPVAYDAGGTQQTPVLQIDLWSQDQFANPNANLPDEHCFVLVDLSTATIADWGDDEGFTVGLEVPAGANVTYDCPDWDFATFGDPATVFSADVWKIGIGGPINPEYKTELNISPEDEPYIAGGKITYGQWEQPKYYSMGLQVDENFAIIYDDQDTAIRILVDAMGSADSLVNGAYIARTTWGWRLQ